MTDLHTKDRACQNCHRIIPIANLDVQWKNGYRRWVCAGGCERQIAQSLAENRLIESMEVAA